MPAGEQTGKVGDGAGTVTLTGPYQQLFGGREGETGLGERFGGRVRRGGRLRGSSPRRWPVCRWEKLGGPPTFRENIPAVELV